MGDKGISSRGRLFKTPRPVRNLKRTDSEESVKSNGTESSQNSSLSDLTLVAEYDELIRTYKAARHEDVVNVAIDLCTEMEDLRNGLLVSEQECRRLQMQVNEKAHAISDLESKLHLARKMVDQEKRHVKRINDENHELKEQMRLIKDVLFGKNRTLLPNEATEKLKFLNNNLPNMWDPNTSGHFHMGAIPEGNTTGSLLSDFSFSRSEDDLDSSAIHAACNWKKVRPSTGAEPISKKRRSSTHRVVEINKNDSIRATTTLTMPKVGPITATSVIESIPNEGDPIIKEQAHQKPSAPPADLIYDMWQSNQNQDTQSQQRQHLLQPKTVVLPDTCGPCEKKLRFGKTALKCKDCRAICHPECKNNLPLPCIPYVNTPNRNVLGLISDFTPTSSPMVPAIVVHCLNEIESRGLHEVGIYRVPGSEKEVKSLKERFLRGRGSPCLSQIDIHVICGTVKDFLRNLHEPLVTYKLWPKFSACVEEEANENVTSSLYKLISELPQPNRDTLAYVILHLKRVASSPDCKMPVSNLAKVFGPTIVGYSSSNPSRETLFSETRRQNLVMEVLITLSADYWSGFVNVQTPQTPKLQQTPSTDSLLRPVNRNFFTPHLKSAQKQKIFTTPPNYRC